MGFFAKRREEKEDRQWLETATFEECLETLFGDTVEDDMKRRIRVFYRSKKMDAVPCSQSAVWASLMHYHNIIILPKMEIVASNIAFGVSEMLCEAKDRDPYVAKALYERLFAKWPEALRYTIHAAQKEDSEKNLIFLCCTQLFGWAEIVEPALLDGYLRKLRIMGVVKHPEALDWLKANTSVEETAGTDDSQGIDNGFLKLNNKM